MSTFELFFTIATLSLIFLERGNIKIPNYLIIYLLFAVYVILSDMFLVKDNINLKYFRGNHIVIGFLFLLIIENSEFESTLFPHILKISIAVLIIAFITTIIQETYSRTFFVKQDIIDQQIFRFRSYETYKLASIYSYYTPVMRISLCFSPILAIIVGDELYNIRNGDKKSKTLVYFLLFIGFVFSFLSRTRILLVFYLLVLLLYVHYQGFSTQSIIRTGTVIIFASLILIFVAPKFGIDTERIIKGRILAEAQAGSGNMIKESTRYLAFKIFKQVFKEDKMFGKGRLSLSTDNYTDAHKKDINLLRVLHGRSAQIHVGYLSLLYWYGYFGSFLYILFLIITTKHLYSNLAPLKYWGPFYGWIMYLVYNLTDVAYELNFMGILLVFFVNKIKADSTLTGKKL